MEYILIENMLHIKISSIHFDTIQDFFDEFIPSSKIQHLLIQNKWITIDNENVKREDLLKGEELIINIYPYNHVYKKIDYELKIVYEDEFLLIVDKPKDILVHSDGNKEISLSDYVKSYFYNDSNIEAIPIHRLDKETCGLVVYSKSKIFQPLLDKMLMEKKIRRHYLAFVSGKVEKNNFIINSPIGKDRHNPNKRIIYKNGQEAITKVIKVAEKNNISILRCVLDTGKTHQIRVHLASVNLPILNDSLYGVKTNKIIRMGLVADEVEFFHPLKEENIEATTLLPNDLSKLYFEITK